jgi:hypothetical protein
MDPSRALLIFGVSLLAVSALLGFAQARTSRQPEAFARWRVVHNGGTAGAVQLLALAAVWHRLANGRGWTVALAWGLIFATWAFFLGPLARALGRPRLASGINILGAVAAVPAYAALPAVLLF